MLYLIATIAGERVALPAESIESVVELTSILPVPRVRPHIAGLAALRSRVLTIVDCRQSLGLAAALPGGMVRAVIVAVDAHQYGLLVDDVTDVVSIDQAPRRAPVMPGPGWARVASLVVEHDGEVLLVIDPAALVEGPAIAA